MFQKFHILDQYRHRLHGFDIRVVRLLEALLLEILRRRHHQRLVQLNFYHLRHLEIRIQHRQCRSVLVFHTRQVR
jgi:hypothetical protein